MFSDVAQKIEERNPRRPRGVVHEARGIGRAIEIEPAAQLRGHAGDVVLQNLWREELPFLRLAARIADGAGGAAGHGDGRVSGELKPAQRQQRDEAADVQAVAGRVEAAVKRDFLPMPKTGIIFWNASAFNNNLRVGAI